MLFILYLKIFFSLSQICSSEQNSQKAKGYRGAFIRGKKLSCDEKSQTYHCQSQGGCSLLGTRGACLLWLVCSLWASLWKLLVITWLNRCSYFRSFEICQFRMDDVKELWLAASSQWDAFIEPTYLLGPKEKGRTRQSKAKHSTAQ
jgi:hypothetical protein